MKSFVRLSLIAFSFAFSTFSPRAEDAGETFVREARASGRKLAEEASRRETRTHKEAQLRIHWLIHRARELHKLGDEAFARELLKRESVALIADATGQFEKSTHSWNSLSQAQYEIGDKTGGRETLADEVKRSRTIVNPRMKARILENVIETQLRADDPKNLRETIAECLEAVESSNNPQEELKLKEWRKIRLLIWGGLFAEAFAAIQNSTDPYVRRGHNRADLLMLLAEYLKTDETARTALKMDLDDLIDKAKHVAVAARDNEILLRCGIILAEIGKLEAARETILGVDNVADPSIRRSQGSSLLGLAERQLKAGKREEAISSARAATLIAQAIHDDPNNQELFMSWAVDILRIAGDLDAALETLEDQSATVYGFDPLHCWSLVDALKKVGRDQDAAKLLNRARVRAEANFKESLLDLEPKNIIPWKLADARAAVLAELLFRSDETDKAIQTFDRVPETTLVGRFPEITLRDSAKTAFAEYRVRTGDIATARRAIASISSLERRDDATIEAAIAFRERSKSPFVTIP